jgi:hypothetical protein
MNELDMLRLVVEGVVAESDNQHSIMSKYNKLKDNIDLDNDEDLAAALLLSVDVLAFLN